MNPSQRIAPMLAYEDGNAAMDWLMRAFGFVEVERWRDENGRLSHGELKLGDQSLFLATPTPLYQSPSRVRRHYRPAEEWSSVPYIINGVMLYVEDVETTLERASKAGARILSEIEDGQPGRRFRAEDPEGHRWFVFELPRDG